MKMKKKNFIISGILFMIFILFTILVKFFDVQTAINTDSEIGLFSVNNFFFDLCGQNIFFYKLTEILGYIALLVAAFYGILGLIQLVKRKSLLKIDKGIIALGLFYIAILMFYIFFEFVVINYRPVLIDGQLEASYPSSHTILTICICGSAIIYNKLMSRKKIIQLVNTILKIIIFITVVGRLLSGVHWFTDILGGIILSSSLLYLFYSVMKIVKELTIRDAKSKFDADIIKNH